ncbi:class 1 fructose-bisphosphatase [Lentibacter algarum]|uniref:class 1 fructose-bisphosphatase n=1 Tax=Lentibacter algarum TaxID=576131 RepID=UPI001C071142|nr:class 1 fructose-bisphosphatase [Lentibacter algarum]MBU2981571.1 class 1 fructose-bisphosphatase [Lentibacter algarum]
MSLSPKRIPADLLPIMDALTRIGRDVAGIIARGALGDSLSVEVGENSDGDGQKALDVMADELFEAALRETAVKYYASEEQEVVLDLGEGKYALAIDPLDGSSNIDVNVSIGTIFSIFEAKDGAEESFLRPAHEQVAGGYIVFGPQTGMAVTFGDGVLIYAMDPASGEFLLVEEDKQIVPSSKEFAINASNRRHWVKGARSYIEECEAGETGSKGKNMNMRWVGSLVAEAHRILTRGGVFLYPADERKGYENGRLRMTYECAPIAFLIEQAGGEAHDGVTRILDKTAPELHARTPLVFGSVEEVRSVKAHYEA